MHFGLDVAVSGLATAIAVVLFVLALRRLLASVPRGGLTYPAPRRVQLIAGWVGLVAFVAGIGLGRAFWP